jgi:hypothetical protein
MTSAAKTTLIFEGVHFVPYGGQRRFRVVMEPGQDWRFDEASLICDHWFEYTRRSPTCVDLLDGKGTTIGDKHIDSVSKELEALLSKMQGMRVQSRIFVPMAWTEDWPNNNRHPNPHLSIVRVS